MYQLCYVDYAGYSSQGILIFTDNFREAWGDDWDDSPASSNAGYPYDDRGNLRYFAYMAGDKTPLICGDNIDRYSVQEINKNYGAWLTTELGALNGGATLRMAKKWLNANGMWWGELKPAATAL